MIELFRKNARWIALFMILAFFVTTYVIMMFR